MAMPKRYYWLKLKDDFFKSKEVRKLRKLAGGEVYVIIYLEMMLLALKSNGKLYFDGIEDSFVEELALELGEDAEHVEVVVNFLSKWGLLIDMGESTEFLLSQVPEITGSETAGAERTRRYRAKNKLTAPKQDYLDDEEPW